MTTESVLDYRGQTGAHGRIARALLGLDVVEPTTDRHDFGLRLWGHGALAKLHGGGWHHRLIVTPGAVQLSTCQRPGWEKRTMAPRAVAALVAELKAAQFKLAAVDLREPWYESYELQDALLSRIGEIRHLLALVKREGKRGDITAWSSKSQRRMLRRVASFDWAAFQRPGYVPAMVTLTYPGDWLAFAPSGATVKRHLRAFRAWFARRTDGGDRGLWKLEIQRRGAPHVHLLLLVPDYPHLRREAVNDGASFADECRAAWHRIVFAGVARCHGPFTAAHSDRDGFHARAGVSVDLGEGARMVDPVRIGAYFAKHGRHGGKAYQHELPSEWIDAAAGDDEARPGRWWGYWRMQPVEVDAELDVDDTVELRRLMRRYVAAQGPRPARVGISGASGAPVRPRAFQRSVERTTYRDVFAGERGVWHAEPEAIDFDTGEIVNHRRKRRRNVNRRYSVRTLAHPVPTGFLLVNDAPALVVQMARALLDPPDWPPGERRPLP